MPRYIGAYKDEAALAAFLKRFRTKKPATPTAHLVAAEVGTSVEGRPIEAYRLTGDDTELTVGARSPLATRRPSVLYTAGCHGMEFIGVEMVLALMEWFFDPANEARVASLIEGCDIFFLPLLNPDGYIKNVYHQQRFALSAVRANANGVDLNRNFPVKWGERVGGFHIFAGSATRFSMHYRGPEPLSEPESRALVDLVRRIQGVAQGETVRPGDAPLRGSLSFHSASGIIGHPYCHTGERAPDFDRLRALALEMQRRQPHEKYRVMQEYEYYPTMGDINDWLYCEMGVLPFLVELSHVRPGRDLRSWFNPFCWFNPADIERCVENFLEPALTLAQWCSQGKL